MFGLLKKSDFDAEMILLKSQMNSSTNAINNNQNNSNELLKQLIQMNEKVQTQLKQQQNQILDLKNNIEKLIHKQQNNIVFQNDQLQLKSPANIHNKITNFNFQKLNESIKSFVKNRSGISTSTFDIILQENKKIDVNLKFRNFSECQINNKNLGPEKALTEHICNYLNQNDFKYKSEFPLNINNNALRGDFLIENEFYLEIKRWDFSIREKNNCNGYETITDYGSDRFKHYRDMDRLCHYKTKNPQKRCVFISVTENKENIFAQKNVQKRSNFYKCTNIIPDEEYVLKLKNKNYRLDENFDKIYEYNTEFDFEYIDNVTHQILKRKCEVLSDEIVDNMSEISQITKDRYQNQDIYLMQLPTNWRIRIIEVL